MGGSPRTPQGRSTRGIYNDYQHFLLLGEAPRTTRCCATHGIYNILLTVSYSREGSADHSMSIKPWNLQHICRIFLSSGKLRGPLDVMQRMEFAIYYQHFPILGRGLRTTRCWSNRGIWNSLSTFPAPRRSSDDHSTSCNAWNLQYIINISLFSGEIRAPLDVDQTIDFTIDYQHFRVLGGGSEDHTMSCNAWNLQYIKSMFPDIICNIGNIINY